MDDTEDDARYPPNPYAVNYQQGYGSSSRQKLSVRNAPYSRPVGSQYVDEEDDMDEDDEEELGEEEETDDLNNGFRNVHKDLMDDDEDEEEEEEEDDGDDEDDDKQKSFSQRIEDVDLERHPKKRKLKSLVSSYEFAPRIPPPSAAAPPPAAPKPSFGGRNSLTDWTERETFVLLDAWGDRFLHRGRKSLRSEEWQEVAEKVSEISKIERTDTQCRNRLDTLKKKYKKEKIRMAETGDAMSKWVYFKKMDVLLSSPPTASRPLLWYGFGEYVFMNPKVYLNRANGLDEMRDSPGNSEPTDREEDDSDGLPPKKRKFGRVNDEGSSFRLLADSIHKFSEIYEKIETNKRQQMVELEKMRMDFHRELEMQKRQILERAQTEIAKIRQVDDEENDISAENASG